jgi:hypothetical protein
MPRREGGSKPVETHLDDAGRVELRRRCCTSLLYWRSLGGHVLTRVSCQELGCAAWVDRWAGGQRVLATALANAGRYRGPAFC